MISPGDFPTPNSITPFPNTARNPSAIWWIESSSIYIKGALNVGNMYPAKVVKKLRMLTESHELAKMAIVALRI